MKEGFLIKFSQNSRLKERSVNKISKDLNDHFKNKTETKPLKLYNSIDYSNSVDNFNLEDYNK